MLRTCEQDYRFYGAGRSLLWRSYKDFAPTEPVFEDPQDGRRKQFTCSSVPFLLFAIFFFSISFAILAHVAELADAYGSGPYGATRGGSSPLVSIN